MKICFKCGVPKEKSEFYAHPAMGDGLLGKCKECTKADARAHRASNHARVAAYDRERFKQPERKAKSLQSQTRRRHRHPEKTRCYNLVCRSIKRGELERQPCVHCGNPKSQAHHHDYSKPLDVKWVCFRCHREKEHGQKLAI